MRGGGQTVPRSLSSSNFGTAQWGLKPRLGLDFGSRHPPSRTLKYSINFDLQCLTTPLWGRSVLLPPFDRWGTEALKGVTCPRSAIVNQLKRLAQSASTQLFHSLEHTWEQKEAGKYTSLCKQDELNQLTSVNWGLLFIKHNARKLGGTNCFWKSC